MKAKRLLYLFYYLRKLDRKKLRGFLTYASRESGRSRISLLLASVFCVFRYNTSILDYFFFRFYEKNREERLKWAGTGFMYEYQKRMNPMGAREVLENKILFSQRYQDFYGRAMAEISHLTGDKALAERLIGNDSGKLVLKNSRGQAGQEIEIIGCEGLDHASLLKRMKNGGFDLVEEFIVQHPDLMSMSPSGLNTVRIISQVVDGSVKILAARLRITINSVVDNMAAGNVAVPLDMETGVITGLGVYSDISKEDISVHPVTEVNFDGFRVPHWEKIIRMIHQAALLVPDNRSIGWDVAVCPDGPLLVEGNHNWCKLLWQLPVKQGLKAELLTFS